VPVLRSVWWPQLTPGTARVEIGLDLSVGMPAPYPFERADIATSRARSNRSASSTMHAYRIAWPVKRPQPIRSLPAFVDVRGVRSLCVYAGSGLPMALWSQPPPGLRQMSARPRGGVSRNCVDGAKVRQIIGLRLEFTRRIEDCCS
jgi:hypothetical protein